MSSSLSQEKFCVAFDLDGVLFNTHAAVLAAYMKAGVDPDIVEANWGKPWLDWGPVNGYTSEHHAAKKAWYSELTMMVAPLPPLWYAQRLKNWTVLTSASAEAALTLMKLAEMPVDRIGGCGLEWNQKANHIILDLPDRGVYIDDSMFLGMEIIGLVQQRKPGWTFVHYHGQSSAELEEEVEAWTQ